MKLHLPKSLFIAVLAAGTAAYADTGFGETNRFYIGGNKASHLSLPGAETSDLTYTTDTTDGVTTATTSLTKIDFSGTEQTTIVFRADDGAADGTPDATNAEIGTVTVSNGTTLEFAINGWHESRYFDALTIDTLNVNDQGSVNINVSKAEHNVIISSVKGSVGTINNAGTLTIGADVSLANVTNTGTLTLKGAVNEENISVSTGHLIISSETATATGKLYSNGGHITLGDGTTNGIITVGRVEVGDKNGGDSLSFNVESGYTLKVTGSTNTIANSNVQQYKNNSFIVSEWENVTTMNVEGTVLAKDAAVLTGDREAIFNIENGGTLAAKGLGRANTSKTGTSQLNLKAGGKLVLGDMGVDFGGHLAATISGGTIGLAAASATISEALNITGDLTIDTTKYSYGETALVQGTEGGKLILAADLTGDGSLTAVGNGTLQFGAISSAVDISAGTANIIFGGTLTLGDGAVFTSGSGSYSLDATDMDLFGVAQGSSYVNQNGEQSTNGFAAGARELITGGTIEGAFTFTYGGNSFTIDNEHRSFTVGSGADTSKWYINAGSSSVSEIYAANPTADISLAAGTTLNVDASVSSHVELKGNATLNISKDITMNHADVSIADGAKATLTGEGIYNAAVSSINDDQNSGSSGLNIAVDSSWKGQVNLVSSSTTAAGVTWLNLNAYGNENSTIKLTGLKGYLCAANSATGVTFKSKLILENSNLAALELNNGCSGDKFTFAGDISGNGNFIKNNGQNQDFTFRGNVENWTGNLNLNNGNDTQSNVTFTGKATSIKNLNIQTTGSNKIKAAVKFENTEAVTVASNIKHSNTNAASYLNLEVNTAKGTTFTGVVDASKLEVKTSAKASFTNSNVKLKDILVNAAAELSFSGVESLSVNTLELGSNASVKVGTASSVKNLTVTSKATLKGGELNANLTMADNSTLQMDAAVSMGGAALTLGSNISLTGALATEIKSITTNSQQVVLFTGVNSLSLSGTTYDPSARVSYTPVEISSIFNIEGAAPESEVKLYFDNGTIYAGLTAAVPEPATATLSLLALAGLCARRRRK